MVGCPELILLLILAGAPVATVFVLAGPRLFRKALYRFERHHALSEYHTASIATRQERTASLILPISLALAVLVVSVPLGLVWPQTHYAGGAFLTGRLLGLVFVTYALLQHIRCRSRTRKYTAFLAGLASISTGTWIGLAATTRLEHPNLSPLFVALLILINPAMIMFSGIAALRYWSGIVRRHLTPTLFLRRSYNVLTLPHPLVLALLAWCAGTWLILLYCLARFVIVQHLLARPLLYFRAFQYVDGPRAFAEIIAPAAGPFGPFVILVHRNQAPDALLPALASNRIVQAVAPSDQHWRECVTRYLEDCTVAIIDLTQSTESLHWEMREALHVIGPDRTVIVCERNCNASAMTVSALPYEFDRPIPSREAIRRRLESATA
jgi:hypothetical protein